MSVFSASHSDTSPLLLHWMCREKSIFRWYSTEKINTRSSGQGERALLDCVGPLFLDTARGKKSTSRFEGAGEGACVYEGGR